MHFAEGGGTLAEKVEDQEKEAATVASFPLY